MMKPRLTLLQLVDDLRADLAQPDLPFIACTIGEMADGSKLANRVAMNRLLLALPAKRAYTACVMASSEVRLRTNPNFEQWPNICRGHG